MTDSERPEAAAEPDPPSFLSYRGRIGRGIYFLGLLLEVVLLFVGVASLAAANNPTGGGGGPWLLFMFIPLVVWLHSLLVTKRLRDAGQGFSTIVIFAVGPFIWIPVAFAIALIAGDETLEIVAAPLWQPVVFVMVGLILAPGLFPRKAEAAGAPAH